MTTRPYELLARFNNDGKVAGVHVRTITTVDGRDFESDPKPLLGATDPAFIAFANQFAASVTTERDTLRQRVTELEQTIAPKDSLIEQLQSQVSNLQSELESLRNPPRPTSVTPAQIRVWLILNVGPQVLDNIDAMLSQIPDEATRKIAKIKWEYGITVLRNDPLVVQFAQALGFDEQQMDRAFLEASQIG